MNLHADQNTPLIGLGGGQGEQLSLLSDSRRLSCFHRLLVSSGFRYDYAYVNLFYTSM